MNLKRARCEDQSCPTVDQPPSAATHDSPLCHTVRVGSRRSNLALIQTNLVIEKLRKVHSNITFEIVTMDTLGDKELSMELHKIGGKNLFTKELEDALLNKTVDFVVHSMKDLPTEMPDPSLVIGCVIQRESCFDVVIFRDRNNTTHNSPLSLATLPVNSVVGTSSVRRVAALKRAYPHLQFQSVRGNLNTRLNKLDAPKSTASLNEATRSDVYYDAIVLARAGVDRMGWSHMIGEVLSSELQLSEDELTPSSLIQHSISNNGSLCNIQDVSGLYAVGQGALACECRRDDEKTLAMLSVCHNETSALTCIAERSFMHSLGGSCATPIAVRSDMPSITGLHLSGTVLTPDGNNCLFAKDSIELPLHVSPAIISRDNELVCSKRLRHEDEYLSLDSSCHMNFSDPESEFYCDCSCAKSLTLDAYDKELQPCKDGDATQSRKQLFDTRDSTGIQDGLINVKEPVLGVLIHPICRVAVKRMMEAKKLGQSVASVLFKFGARDILNKSQPALKLLPAPDKRVSEVPITRET